MLFETGAQVSASREKGLQILQLVFCMAREWLTKRGEPNFTIVSSAAVLCVRMREGQKG